MNWWEIAIATVIVIVAAFLVAAIITGRNE